MNILIETYYSKYYLKKTKQEGVYAMTGPAIKNLGTNALYTDLKLDGEKQKPVLGERFTINLYSDKELKNKIPGEGISTSLVRAVSYY